MLSLFWTFFKIGALTFGGGYAMIPLVQEEVLLHGWMNESDFLSFIAIAESTPGPVSINMATFVGAIRYGLPGALLATLGVVLPSFIIIVLIASMMRGIMKYAGVKAVLKGLKPVVSGLILSAGITLLLLVMLGTNKIGGTFTFKWGALIVLTVVMAVHFIYKKIKKKPISPIILICISAVLGMLLFGVLGLS